MEHLANTLSALASNKDVNLLAVANMLEEKDLFLIANESEKKIEIRKITAPNKKYIINEPFVEH